MRKYITPLAKLFFISMLCLSTNGYAANQEKNTVIALANDLLTLDIPGEYVQKSRKDRIAKNIEENDASLVEYFHGNITIAISAVRLLDTLDTGIAKFYFVMSESSVSDSGVSHITSKRDVTIAGQKCQRLDIDNNDPAIAKESLLTCLQGRALIKISARGRDVSSAEMYTFASKIIASAEFKEKSNAISFSNNAITFDIPNEYWQELKRDSEAHNSSEAKYSYGNKTIGIATAKLPISSAPAVIDAMLNEIKEKVAHSDKSHITYSSNDAVGENRCLRLDTDTKVDTDGASVMNKGSMLVCAHGEYMITMIALGPDSSSANMYAILSKIMLSAQFK